MYQHQVCLEFNPAWVVIGTDNALPIKKGADTKLIVQTIDISTNELEHVGIGLCNLSHGFQID